MKKIFTIILILLSTFCLLSAEWNYQFNGQNVGKTIQQGDFLYINRGNGITEVNLITTEMKNLNTLNSGLKWNNVNSFLKLDDGTILISTLKGLSILENNIITSNKPICKNYPDSDARLLYQSSDGVIWTFSSNKVYYYYDDIWRTINLADSLLNIDSTISPYDIQKLLIRKNEVWAIYNDNNKSSLKFYDRYYSTPYLKIAILDYDGIIKILKKDSELPFEKGDISLVDYNDIVYLKNGDNIFSYENEQWKKPIVFATNMTKPYSYQNLMQDDSGKVWYIGSKNGNYFPISYNPSNGEFIMHLQEVNDKWILNLAKMSDGTIVANSSKSLYFFIGNGWKIISIKNFGLDSTSSITPILTVANKNKYIQVNYAKTEIRGTLINLESKTKILPIKYDFPYSLIQKVDVNKFGKRVLDGANSYYEPYSLETDSGFVKFSSFSSITPQVKLAPDGKLFFDGYQTNKDTLEFPYLTTWQGNDLEIIDCGYSNKTKVTLSDFTFKGDLMYSLGSYYFNSGNGEYKVDTIKISAVVDTMANYLSIYNSQSKNLIKYDNTNSDLPNWHQYVFTWGKEWQIASDTIPRCISVDDEYNPWILTSYSLIKFNSNGSQIYNVPKNRNLYQMEYDFKSKELLCCRSSYDKVFFFQIGNLRWDSLEIRKSGIKGNLLSYKKIYDETIVASDDLGYLYKYKGFGKFEAVNLNVLGKNNLGVPIYDFCLGADNTFYLGTEIGLFSNADFTEIKENESIAVENNITYPNPAENELHLAINEDQFDTLKNNIIQVFDLMGILQLSAVADRQDIKIDISKLPKGIYQIVIGKKIHSKFIKV